MVWVVLGLRWMWWFLCVSGVIGWICRVVLCFSFNILVLMVSLIGVRL